MSRKHAARWLVVPEGPQSKGRARAERGRGYPVRQTHTRFAPLTALVLGNQTEWAGYASSRDERGTTRMRPLQETAPARGGTLDAGGVPRASASL